MTTDKLSATVDADLLTEVRDRAGPRGLSAFVARALRHELDRVALRDLLDELADQLGPPDEAMVAEADITLDELAASTRADCWSDSDSTPAMPWMPSSWPPRRLLATP